MPPRFLPTSTPSPPRVTASTAHFLQLCQQPPGDPPETALPMSLSQEGLRALPHAVPPQLDSCPCISLHAQEELRVHILNRQLLQEIKVAYVETANTPRGLSCPRPRPQGRRPECPPGHMEAPGQQSQSCHPQQMERTVHPARRAGVRLRGSVPLPRSQDLGPSLGASGAGP